MTQQEIDRAVSAAFDSVNLVNQIMLEWPPMGDPMPDDVSARLSRNVEHLTLMMTKEWFDQALTAEQRAEIQALIG